MCLACKILTMINCWAGIETAKKDNIRCKSNFTFSYNMNSLLFFQFEGIKIYFVLVVYDNKINSKMLLRTLKYLSQYLKWDLNYRAFHRFGQANLSMVVWF